MSMERMFEDLEARMDHLESQEIRANAEELSRAERAQLTLDDRLRGAVGSHLRVHDVTGDVTEGRLAVVGADWLLLGESEEAGPRVLVPVAAIALVEGLPARVRPARDGAIPDRALPAMLRALARDRELVRIMHRGGEVIGRIAAVGRDALDLASQPSGERSAVSPGAMVTVALGALLSVRAD